MIVVMDSYVGRSGKLILVGLLMLCAIVLLRVFVNNAIARPNSPYYQAGATSTPESTLSEPVEPVQPNFSKGAPPAENVKAPSGDVMRKAIDNLNSIYPNSGLENAQGSTSPANNQPKVPAPPQLNIQ